MDKNDANEVFSSETDLLNKFNDVIKYPYKLGELVRALEGKPRFDEIDEMITSDEWKIYIDDFYKA